MAGSSILPDEHGTGRRILTVRLGRARRQITTLVLVLPLVLVLSLVLALPRVVLDPSPPIKWLRTVTITEVKDMTLVSREAQEGRDASIWAEWCSGLTQRAIAERRGLDQSTVSDSIRRYAASIPPEEKREWREKQLQRYERLYLAHAQAGDERPRVAAIVRGIIDSECRVLGLVQSQLHVEHDGQVQHHHDPGPTVEQLLNRWREQGLLRTLPQAQLQRLDRGGA